MRIEVWEFIYLEIMNFEFWILSTRAIINHAMKRRSRNADDV